MGKLGGADFDIRDINDTYLTLLGLTLVLLTAMLAVFIRNHILEMLLDNLGCIPRLPPPKQKPQHPSGGKRPQKPGDSHRPLQKRGSDTPYIPLRQIASDDGGSPGRGSETLKCCLERRKGREGHGEAIPSETLKQKERRLPSWNSGGNDTKKKNNACSSQLPQDVKKRDDKKKNNNNHTCNFDKRKRNERQPRGLE